MQNNALHCSFFIRNEYRAKSVRYLVYQFDFVNPVYLVANIVIDFIVHIVIDFIVLKLIKNETLKTIEKMQMKKMKR